MEINKHLSIQRFYFSMGIFATNNEVRLLSKESGGSQLEHDQMFNKLDILNHVISFTFKIPNGKKNIYCVNVGQNIFFQKSKINFTSLLE